jgi:hypothetical protein
MSEIIIVNDYTNEILEFKPYPYGKYIKAC